MIDLGQITKNETGNARGFIWPYLIDIVCHLWSITLMPEFFKHFFSVFVWSIPTSKFIFNTLILIHKYDNTYIHTHTLLVFGWLPLILSMVWKQAINVITLILTMRFYFTRYQLSMCKCGWKVRVPRKKCKPSICCHDDVGITSFLPTYCTSATNVIRSILVIKGRATQCFIHM